MAERYQPLYSAVEMRAAEERYPGFPDTIPELMDRAGGAVAREAMLAYPEATRFACVCGGGSNGGDGRVAARVLREAGHLADEVEDGLDDYDVVIDGLFGTGFHGAPRPEATAIIERINASPAAVVSVDVPFGRRCVDGRDRGRRGGRRSHCDLPRREGRSRRGAGSVRGRPGRHRRYRAGARADGDRASDAGRARRGSPAKLRRYEVQLRCRPRRRRAAGDDGRRLPQRDGGSARRCRIRDARSPRGSARHRRGHRA